jgi:hypothetical protein
MSLVCDERDDRLDKKDDQSCERGQRESLIDTRAADHCYHEPFPIQGGSARTDLLSRCAASVNEALRASAPGLRRNKPVTLAAMVK